MTQTISPMDETMPPMQVLDIDAAEPDFASSDGRYFTHADVLVRWQHDLVHSLLDRAEAEGHDRDEFSAACHILLNLTQDSLDRMADHITAELTFALADAEDPNDA